MKLVIYKHIHQNKMNTKYNTKKNKQNLNVISFNGAEL